MKLFLFSLLYNIWLKFWNIIPTYWSKQQGLRLVQLYNVRVPLWQLIDFFDKVLQNVNSYSMFFIFPGRVDKGNCNTVVDVPW